MKPSRQLLSLLEMWTWEHLENLLNAPPAGPGQHLGQSDAQGSIATVHIGDVIGVLEDRMKTLQSIHPQHSLFWNNYLMVLRSMHYGTVITSLHCCNLLYCKLMYIVLNM